MSEIHFIVTKDPAGLNIPVSYRVEGEKGYELAKFNSRDIAEEFAKFLRKAFENQIFEVMSLAFGSVSILEAIQKFRSENQ